MLRGEYMPQSERTCNGEVNDFKQRWESTAEGMVPSHANCRIYKVRMDVMELLKNNSSILRQINPYPDSLRLSQSSCLNYANTESFSETSPCRVIVIDHHCFGWVLLRKFIIECAKAVSFFFSCV